MNTNTTNTQTAHASQNDAQEDSAAFILGKIEREIGGARAAIEHVVCSLIPELRDALAGVKTYEDPRGAEYGHFRVTQERDVFTVTHSKEGYTITAKGEDNFNNWLCSWAC